MEADAIQFWTVLDGLDYGMTVFMGDRRYFFVEVARFPSMMIIQIEEVPGQQHLRHYG